MKGHYFVLLTKIIFRRGFVLNILVVGQEGCHIIISILRQTPYSFQNLTKLINKILLPNVPK